MNEDDFKKVLADRGWKDEWWVAVDGAVLDGRLSLKEALSVKQQMPTRQVALMHPKSVDLHGVDWKNLDLTVSQPGRSGNPSVSKGTSPGIATTSREITDMRNQIRNINEDLNDIKETYQQISEVIIEGFADIAQRINDQTEQLEQLKLMFGQMIDLKKFKEQLDERQKRLKQEEMRKQIEREKADGTASPTVDLDEEPRPLPSSLKLPGRVVGTRRSDTDSGGITPPPPPMRKPQKPSLPTG